MMRWFVVICLLVGVWQAGSLVLVELLNRRVSLELEGRSNHAPLQLLEFAASIYPDHPMLLRLKVRTAETLEDQIRFQRALTVVAEQSPAAWSELFQLKTRAREFDDELYHALDRVMHLGAFDPWVQERVIPSGVGAWFQLTQEGKNHILALAENVLTGEAIYRLPERIEMLREVQLLDIVCQRLSSGNETHHEHCLDG